MRDDEIHSDDSEEKRKYLSDLARLKKIRARHKKANSSILLQNQVSYKRASIYEIDAEGNTTGIEDEKIFALQKEPEKELDIAIARKDYKDYIKQQNEKRKAKEAEKKELEIFPIKREEKKETKGIPKRKPKIKVIKKEKKREVKKIKKPQKPKNNLLVSRKNQPIPIVRRSKKTENKAAKTKDGKIGKRVKKLFSTVFLLVLLLGFSYFAYGFFYKQSGYYTIAIFGVDSRGGETEAGALADVDIVCNINRETKEIQLVSIYRDTYSMIDASGKYHKLNEAYFLGGHKQAVATLERMLDIKIDDYITFNWKSVVDAINILGGVDVEISEAEFEYINSFITETVKSTGIGSHQLAYPGKHHLDGVQAVAYARLRLMDTDFNRTERQRKIADLALEKAKQSDFNTLKNLVLSVYPEVSSSISVDDLIPLARDADKYKLTDSLGFPFDNDTKDIGKLNYVIPVTLESNVRKLHELLYKNSEYSPSRELIDISNYIVEKSGLGTKSSVPKKEATSSQVN